MEAAARASSAVADDPATNRVTALLVRRWDAGTPSASQKAEVEDTLTEPEIVPGTETVAIAESVAVATAEQAATEFTTGELPHPISTSLRRVLKDATYRGMDTHPTVGGSFRTRDQTAHV